MQPAPDIRRQIETFLACPAFAVIGASEDPSKFGHRVFASYLRHGRTVYPVNPRATLVLGHPVYPDLAALPVPVEAVSIITPPPVTERVMDDVIAAGVKHVWMQPGADSPGAVHKAREAGLNVIFGGPCLLIEIGKPL